MRSYWHPNRKGTESLGPVVATGCESMFKSPTQIKSSIWHKDQELLKEREKKKEKLEKKPSITKRKEAHTFIKYNMTKSRKVLR